jgi:hypothetical protein
MLGLAERVTTSVEASWPLVAAVALRRAHGGHAWTCVTKPVTSLAGRQGNETGSITVRMTVETTSAIS